MTDVHNLAKAIVDSLVRLELRIPRHQPSIRWHRQCTAYAKEVLTLGLVWWGFHDAIREGVGKRVLIYWKFLSVLFKKENHRNYSCEAAKLLPSHAYYLSPRQSAQLQWSRFINRAGRPGCNIPADLHMEHLNRRFEMALAGLHANVTTSAINRTGRSLGVVHHICDAVMQDLHLKKSADRHAPPSSTKDFQLILECLLQEQVFLHKADRKYASSL